MKRTLTLVALLAGATPMLLARLPQNLYGRSATGTHGVVAAAKPDASQIGVNILKAGGNAVDAAIATGFALGVLEPNATGIGGGGFMIVRLANMKEAVVIDFREIAPAASSPDMFKLDDKGHVVNDASTVGGLASGIPGEVAGLLYAFEHFGSGKLSRAQMLQPAIDWANHGYTVTVNLSNIIKEHFDTIKKYPATAAIYLKDGLPGTSAHRCMPPFRNLYRKPSPKPMNTVRACAPRSSPTISTSAHAVPSGYLRFRCSFTISDRRSGIISSTPSNPPTSAIAATFRYGSS